MKLAITKKVIVKQSVILILHIIILQTLLPATFFYIISQNCKADNDEAVELAWKFQEEICYKKAKVILQNYDQNIERKKYYNLTEKEATKKFNTQKQLQLFFAYLDQKDSVIVSTKCINWIIKVYIHVYYIKLHITHLINVLSK